MFWSDAANEMLVRDHYPQFLEGYLSITKGVIKSDIARCLYMHRYGGMYADMDFVCLRPFDQLLSGIGSGIVIGKMGSRRQPRPNAWLYSFKPGDSFWLYIVKDGLDAWKDGARKVTKICGPDRLDWVMNLHHPNATELAPNLIYPINWANDHHMEFSGKLDWSDIPKLQETFPESLAVTPWAHQW
jgi:hypothetical protein